MPLFMLVLRLTMVLLNVYDTFKVLKIPISRRSSDGLPSQRSLVQRKRNMKGCLAVWIVWLCFMMYERLAEGVVSLFVPFYDEFKSLAILFLILTRARGAEPIYLHFIRPLLKPYTSTLDTVFDVVRMFGDIIFVVSTYPLRLASDWWHHLFHSTEGSADSDEQHHGGLYAEVQHALQSVSSQIPINGARRRSIGHIRDPAFGGAPEQYSPSPPAYAEVGSGATMTPPVMAHQIWHPPPAAYHDEDEDYPGSSLSYVETDSERKSREQHEEWRQYPAFPSAYPPTPLAPSTYRTLPSVSTVSLTSFAPIQEEEEEPMYPVMQGFYQSLPSLHDSPSFGHATRDVSDDKPTPETHDQHGGSPKSAPLEDLMEEDDDEEDAFNVTLQTPGALAVPDTVRVTRSKAAAAKTTTMIPLNAMPSLMSRLSSETSSVSDDTPPFAGRKRSREPFASSEDQKSPIAKDIALTDSEVVVPVASPPFADDSSATASEVGMDEDGADESEPLAPYVKRRRVASAPSRIQPRRTTRQNAREPPAQTSVTGKLRVAPRSQTTDLAGARASTRLAAGAAIKSKASDPKSVIASSETAAGRAGRNAAGTKR
ncbi:unnamed protein product [Mycena citricolor]|uniref:Protein YOP1 n=1 Tax=Mycena citricolor TaxID=2018698 RepID=A0AAD2K3D5_9AGAR|nr:unnamed protein product [Mycena citricolor]